jgi:hypothetical protein
VNKSISWYGTSLTGALVETLITVTFTVNDI